MEASVRGRVPKIEVDALGVITISRDFLSAAAAIRKLPHIEPLPILTLVVSFVTLRNRRPTTAPCVHIPYAVRG